MPKSKADRFGVCRLTGKRGKFVKSHLIPRAFTKPEVAGAPLLQAGHGASVTKRFDSWYDQRIVTRDGEDILAEIDGAAISELRRHRLVWSGWGETQALDSEHGHTQIGESPWGIRSLEGVNLRLMRTYFLSLLWRAAATDRFEFGEVTIPSQDLEEIGELVRSGEPGPIDFYPISLIQLSTRGMIHNLSPIRSVKTMPAIDDVESWSVAIFRFYFDGLVAHIHNHRSDDGKTDELGDLIVRGSDRITITTVKYEHSSEAINIRNIILSSTDLD